MVHTGYGHIERYRQLGKIEHVPRNIDRKPSKPSENRSHTTNLAIRKLSLTDETGIVHEICYRGVQCGVEATGLKME
jgi:hypothetical protein